MKLHLNLPENFGFNVQERFVRPVGFLFLFFGLAIFSYSIKVFLDGQDAQKWVLHEAQISSAKIAEGTRSNGRKSYSVEVEYVYEWIGESYEGNQYRLHDNSGSRFKEVDLIVKELLFAKSQKHPYPIYVDPERPETSAILNFVNSETQTASLFLGIIFSVVGAFASLRPSLFTRNKQDTSVIKKEL
ncbi:MAG: DUF3592 domain-containing protein [Litorimonas sp.]